MLLSHPNKELFLHLNNTWILSKDRIFKEFKFSFIQKEDLFKILELTLKLHDLGKGMRYFQEYMKDIESGIKNPRYKHSEEKNHGMISGVLSFAVAFELLQKTEFAFLVFIAVCRHHGNLKDLQEYRADLNDVGSRELLCVQFESLMKKELQDTISKLGYGFFNFKTYSCESFEKTLDLMGSIKTFSGIKKLLTQEGREEGFLFLNYIFSILVYADKLEAILHGNNKSIEEYMELSEKRYTFNSNIVEEYKAWKFSLNDSGISSFRERVYTDVVKNVKELDISQNRVLSINLPTGAGKTLAALKGALLLREKVAMDKGYIPRIIYALPFTTIIDQNYSVFEEVLGAEDSRFLIKHHYLAEKSYQYLKIDSRKTEIDDGYDKYEYDIATHLIESWDSEIVVTTLFQVLHSILSNSNRSLKKFHNMAGSIIILDEVQSIKFEHWILIKRVFQKMANIMKCIFVFMTATMPLIFSEEKSEIFELAKNKVQYFESLNRIKIDVSYLKKDKFTLESLIVFLCGEIDKKNPKSILIVLNTVKSSIYVYNELKKLYKDHFNCYYLSTNIIPVERKRRIKEIKEGSVPKIVVSTQMIEAGVDIDVERVYRDFGPMDSINQTAGRCNRNGLSDSGEVTIFRLVDVNEDTKVSKDFCDYVYDKKLLEATERVLLKHEVIQEKVLFELSESYYRELQSIGSNDKGEALYECYNQLKYSSFSMQKDSFRVIDSLYSTTDLFIQVDERAVLLWEKFQKLWDVKNIFDRKKVFASIKSDFLDYVISVPEYIAKKQTEISEASFTLVSRSMVKSLYDKETGFIRNAERDFFF